MELSKFTANCTKSTQFADPCPELREIHALRAHFSRFFIPSGKIAKIHAIHVMFNSLQISLLEITQATVNSVKSALYLLICNSFIILTLVRQDPAPCLSESHEFCKLKLQFTKYQLRMKFQMLCTH